MFLLFKRLFNDKVTIKIIPHSERSILSISLSRSILFFVIFVFLSLQVTTTILLFHYTTLFESETQRSLRFLERLDEVQYENYKLRNSVEYLAVEAERIRDKLLELEEQDQRIRELINTSETTQILNPEEEIYIEDYHLSFNDMSFYGIDNDLVFNLEFHERLYTFGGIGGRSSLLDVSSFMLLSRAQETFHGLKRAIPEQIEKFEDLKEEVRHYSERMVSIPSIWPLLDDGEGFITSSFGYRVHPISRMRQFHEGVDIAAWYNTPVVSTANGVVEFSGWKGGFGRTVIIDHEAGYKTVYAHNNSLVVEEGDLVKRGDVVAYSGNSGYSTGPHLHYEVLYEGEPKDPVDYF